MRKIGLLLSLFFLCTLSLVAQVEHMKFMGIPITGTPSQMGEKLKAKGFSYIKDLDEDIREYSGKFAGSNVTIYAYSKNRIVYTIVVEYPEENSFSELKNKYEKMVGQYTLKYGNPYSHTETFIDPYYEGDGYELQALRTDKCVYRTSWIKDLGNIAITLSNTANLWIFYQDRNGADEVKKMQNQEIQDDI